MITIHFAFESFHFDDKILLFICSTIFILIIIIFMETDAGQRHQKRRKTSSVACSSSGADGTPPKKDEKKNKARKIPKRDRDKDETLCTEIRKSLIHQLQDMTKDSFPYQPHPLRWRWAINHVTNNDGKNWDQLLSLFNEIKEQGEESAFFKATVKVIQEVERWGGGKGGTIIEAPPDVAFSANRVNK